MGMVGPPHDDKPPISVDEEGPVTVIVTRRAKRDKIEQFEKWMDGIIHEAMKFEGHMGVNIIRPSEPSNPEYTIIFRFDNVENLSKWERSEIRKKWIKESKYVAEGDAKIEKQTGLEFWFTPLRTNEQVVAIPPRYKMAVVTGAVVFVLISTLLPQIRQLTVTLPAVLSTLVGVVIMVLLMTYVVMPTVTKLLRPWLSKKKLY